jgi:hypothetical protein
MKTVKTMRRLYRMTLQRPEMNSQGQIAPTRVSLTSSRQQELLIGQLLRNVRNLRVKPDILKNSK